MDAPVQSCDLLQEQEAAQCIRPDHSVSILTSVDQGEDQPRGASEARRIQEASASSHSLEPAEKQACPFFLSLMRCIISPLRRLL